MTKQYRLREIFNYNTTGPTYFVVEEKKLFVWKNVYGDACSLSVLWPRFLSV